MQNIHASDEEFRNQPNVQIRAKVVAVSQVVHRFHGWLVGTASVTESGEFLCVVIIEERGRFLSFGANAPVVVANLTGLPALLWSGALFVAAILLAFSLTWLWPDSALSVRTVKTTFDTFWKVSQ